MSASLCGGGPGRGGASSWILPLSLPLSAHTLAGEIKCISLDSRGKCTGERGPNAQFLHVHERQSVAHAPGCEFVAAPCRAVGSVPLHGQSFCYGSSYLPRRTPLTMP